MQEENPQEEQRSQPKPRSELESQLRYLAQRPDDSDEETDDVDDESSDDINYDQNELLIQQAAREEEQRARELKNYELQVAAAATRDALLGMANRIRPDWKQEAPSVEGLPVAKLNLKEKLKQFMDNGSTVALFKNAADMLINEPVVTVNNTPVCAATTVTEISSAPVQLAISEVSLPVRSLCAAHRERNSVLLLNALDRHADPAIILELIIDINNNLQGFHRNNQLIFELVKRAVDRMVKMRNLIEIEPVEIIEKLILIASQPTSRDIRDITKRFSQIRSLIPGKTALDGAGLELLLTNLKGVIQKINPEIQVLGEVFFFRDINTLMSLNKHDVEKECVQIALLEMNVFIIRALDQFIPHLKCKSLGYAQNSLHRLIYQNNVNSQICEPVLIYKEIAFQHANRFSRTTHSQPASKPALSDLMPQLDDELHTRVSNELVGALFTRTGYNSSMACLGLTRLITTGKDSLFAFNYKLVIALFRHAWKSADPVMQMNIREYLNTLNHPIITDAVYPMLNHNIQHWFVRASVLCLEIKNKTEDPTYPLTCKIENCISILMECKRSYNRRQSTAGFEYFYQFLERYAPACVSKDFAIENHTVDEKGSHINVGKNSKGEHHYTTKQKSNSTLLLHQAIEEGNLNRKLHLFNGAIDSMIQRCEEDQLLNLEELKKNIDLIMIELKKESPDIQKFIAIALILAVSAKLTKEHYSKGKSCYEFSGPSHAVKLMKFLKNTHRFPLGLVLQESGDSHHQKLDIKKIDTLWAACVKEVKATEKKGWKASVWDTRGENTDITYQLMNGLVATFEDSIVRASDAIAKR